MKSKIACTDSVIVLLLREIGMLRNEIQRLKMALAVQEQENEK